MSKCSKKCNEIKSKIDSISGLDDETVYDWLKRLDNVTTAITDIIDDYSNRNELNGTCFKSDIEGRLKLDFSKNGEGAILMTAIGNSLYLDKVNRDLKLGELVNFNDKDIEKIAQLNFYKVESINILIEKLISIRNNLILSSAS